MHTFIWRDELHVILKCRGMVLTRDNIWPFHWDSSYNRLAHSRMFTLNVNNNNDNNNEIGLFVQSIFNSHFLIDFGQTIEFFSKYLNKLKIWIESDFLCQLKRLEQVEENFLFLLFQRNYFQIKMNNLNVWIKHSDEFEWKIPTSWFFTILNWIICSWKFIINVMLWCIVTKIT